MAWHHARNVVWCAWLWSWCGVPTVFIRRLAPVCHHTTQTLRPPQTCTRKTLLDRGRIEVRPTALLRYHAHRRFDIDVRHWHLTLTYDLDFQFQANYDHNPHTHTNLEFICQSVQKIEWKQTDGPTDGRNRLICLPAANAVFTHSTSGPIYSLIKVTRPATESQHYSRFNWSATLQATWPDLVRRMGARLCRITSSTVETEVAATTGGGAKIGMRRWCRLTLIVQTQFLLVICNQELCVDVSRLTAQLRSTHPVSCCCDFTNPNLVYIIALIFHSTLLVSLYCRSVYLLYIMHIQYLLTYLLT